MHSNVLLPDIITCAAYTFHHCSRDSGSIFAVCANHGLSRNNVGAGAQHPSSSGSPSGQLFSRSLKCLIVQLPSGRFLIDSSSLFRRPVSANAGPLCIISVFCAASFVFSPVKFHEVNLLKCFLVEFLKERSFILYKHEAVLKHFDDMTPNVHYDPLRYR